MNQAFPPKCGESLNLVALSVRILGFGQHAFDDLFDPRQLGKRLFDRRAALLEQMALVLHLVERAAQMYDGKIPCGKEANMAKLLAADASWAAADMCLQTHGGFGFAEEYDIERKFRETRLYQIAPISTNLILCFIAEQVLGLPKSYGKG